MLCVDCAVGEPKTEFESLIKVNTNYLSEEKDLEACKCSVQVQKCESKMY